MKTASKRPAPKIIKLDSNERYTRLFSAKYGSAVSFRSGCVLLKKGESIGEHNTEDAEEILIILEGKGHLLLGKDERFAFEKGTALYIPPDTVHDVKNTEEEILKYIFVTCPAAPQH